MTEIKKKPQDRPLITFALFAYNQEKYIREALKGAFSQTYEPLEIILSDDCSTDRTFEIMQEMAAAYKGPHDVVLNKNHGNLGLIGHVNLISDLAKGDYIIAAAGDDISLANRAKVISEEIFKCRPSLIHSSIQAIDDMGKPREDIVYNPTLWHTTNPKVAATSISLYIGATGVWNKKLFQTYGKITALNAYEDLVLGYRASLEGTVGFIKNPLVLYRVGMGTSHAPKRTAGRVARRAFLARMNASRVASFEQRLLDTRTSDHTDKSAIILLLEDQIKIYRARYRFYASPFEFIMKDIWKPSIFISFSKAAINSFARRIFFW